MNCDSSEAQAVNSVCEPASNEKHQSKVEWAREPWSFIASGRMSSVPEVTRDEIEGQSVGVGILRGSL